MPVPGDRPIGEPVSTGSAVLELGPRELLRNRTFLLFQARGTLSNVSYTLYVGTILWLTYRLSGGIFLSGVVIGVQTLVFTLTFLISPLVDRLYDKRRSEERRVGKEWRAGGAQYPGRRSVM